MNFSLESRKYGFHDDACYMQSNDRKLLKLSQSVSQYAAAAAVNERRINIRARTKCEEPDYKVFLFLNTQPTHGNEEEEEALNTRTNRFERTLHKYERSIIQYTHRPRTIR